MTEFFHVIRTFRLTPRSGFDFHALKATPPTRGPSYNDEVREFSQRVRGSVKEIK